jgi:hypothetical protein
VNPDVDAARALLDLLSTPGVEGVRQTTTESGTILRVTLFGEEGSRVIDWHMSVEDLQMMRSPQYGVAYALDMLRELWVEGP